MEGEQLVGRDAALSPLGCGPQPLGHGPHRPSPPSDTALSPLARGPQPPLAYTCTLEEPQSLSARTLPSTSGGSRPTTSSEPKASAWEPGGEQAVEWSPAGGEPLTLEGRYSATQWIRPPDNPLSHILFISGSQSGLIP